MTRVNICFETGCFCAIILTAKASGPEMAAIVLYRLFEQMANSRRMENER